MSEEETSNVRQRRTAPYCSNDGSLLPNNGGSSPLTHNYGSAAEYAEAVRVWLWAYHNWYFSKCFAQLYLQQQFSSPQQRLPLTQNGAIPNIQTSPVQNIGIVGVLKLLYPIFKKLL